MAILKGWRYAALIGGLVASIGIAIYPIIIDPMFNPDKYKKIQSVTRAKLRQEDIQPGMCHPCIQIDPTSTSSGDQPIQC